MPVTVVNLTIVAGIFTEGKKMAYPARLTLQHPGGRETEMARFSLGNVDGLPVAREIMPFELKFEFEGLFWLNLYLDGQLRCDAPLRVRYERKSVS